MPRPQPLIIYLTDEDDMRREGHSTLCFRGEGYYWSYADQDENWGATPRGPFKSNTDAYADYARGENG